MDSQTHVVLAKQLLTLCGLNPSLNIVSLFPQIDRTPPTLHRMYAHTVYQAKPISELGLAVLSEPEHFENKAVESPSKAYAIKRFLQERTRILAYREDFKPIVMTSLNASEKEGCLMAYVSHLYLDTYNQPTQPFAPASVYPSGQWALWEVLGEFRLRLYTTPIIDALRIDLFAHPIWQKAPVMTASALTQAMLSRICTFSLNKTSIQHIELGMQALGLKMLLPSEINHIVVFLSEFEEVLNELHIKHLKIDSMDESPSDTSVLALA